MHVFYVTKQSEYILCYSIHFRYVIGGWLGGGWKTRSIRYSL